MQRITVRLAALAVGAFFVVGHSAQGDEPKKSTRPATEVEVFFANGSSVRMILADTPIEVQTPYGKLSVPARDLKRIEFGVHLPDGLNAQIEQAIAKLGSENFRDREAASATLFKLGGLAYPALNDAIKSTDLELSKRAKAAVTKMQNDLPAKDLRTQSSDTIATPTFTVVGKILTPSLKAQADYFGAVQLDLVQLRTLRSTETPAEVTVQVDAHYAAQGSHDWLATEFVLEQRSKLVVAASGQIDLFPQNGGGAQFLSTPKGNPNGGNVAFVGKNRQRVQPGTLIGRVGEGGTPFVIGENYEGNPGGEGKLYLQITPSPWSADLSGSYQVKISAK